MVKWLTGCIWPGKLNLKVSFKELVITALLSVFHWLVVSCSYLERFLRKHQGHVRPVRRSSPIGHVGEGECGEFGDSSAHQL